MKNDTTPETHAAGQAASVGTGDLFGDLKAALNLTRSVKGYSSEQRPEWVYLLKLESILVGVVESSPNNKI